MSAQIIKSLDELAPIFRRPADKWIEQVNRLLLPRGLVVRVTETYRTAERQNELFGLGRNAKGQVIDARKIVTKTTDSNHERRVALDWVPYNPKTKAVLYDSEIYDEVYTKIPLSKYGLERYAWEYPHIQLAGGQVKATELGLYQNIPLGKLPKGVM